MALPRIRQTITDFQEMAEVGEQYLQRLEESGQLGLPEEGSK